MGVEVVSPRERAHPRVKLWHLKIITKRQFGIGVIFFFCLLKSHKRLIRNDFSFIFSVAFSVRHSFLSLTLPLMSRSVKF